MAATPTQAQVIDIRGDVLTFVQGNEKSLDDYIARAFAQLKRDLDDKRNIIWSRIYTGDAYLDNTESTGRNEDKCKHLMCLLSIAYVFEDYAIRAADGSQWWDLYLAYRADYDTTLMGAKLDIDLDDDGSIDEDEERSGGQSFFIR